MREILAYEKRLSVAGLPNIAFHSEPLLNGHKEYGNLTIEQRKKMLVTFSALVRRLPISYTSFVYRRNEYDDLAKLTARMKRDISNLLYDRLQFFQSFDEVKVYYDNGQDIVKQALEQAADYFCTIELAAVKYDANEDGKTYNKFFGGSRDFKKNWLKQARRMSI